MDDFLTSPSLRGLCSQMGSLITTSHGVIVPGGPWQTPWNQPLSLQLSREGVPEVEGRGQREAHLFPQQSNQLHFCQNNLPAAAAVPSPDPHPLNSWLFIASLDGNLVKREDFPLSLPGITQECPSPKHPQKMQITPRHCWDGWSLKQAHSRKNHSV